MPIDMCFHINLVVAAPVTLYMISYIVNLTYFHTSGKQLEISENYPFLLCKLTLNCWTAVIHGYGQTRSQKTRRPIKWQFWSKYSLSLRILVRTRKY
jgi:hypothetical protein